jgi:NAD(P)-dependent dehydrogenase (short-subunit alcohol dehydrogenase family)
MTAMSGKTCLVTGATGGIGKQTALRLAALGATVIIVARDPERGAEVADEIRRRVPPARVVALTADLSSLVQVRRLVRQAEPARQRRCRCRAVVDAQRTTCGRRCA